MKPAAPPKPVPWRETHAAHIENVTNRSGPEVVAALNRAESWFLDLLLARGKLGELAYIPTFQQSMWRYAGSDRDPKAASMVDKIARHSAARAALLPLESVPEMEDNGIKLQWRAIERMKALGIDAVPRQPPAPLVKSMTLNRMQSTVLGAAKDLFPATDILVGRKGRSLAEKAEGIRDSIPGRPPVESAGDDTIRGPQGVG